jgi:hypothetical protein
MLCLTSVRPCSARHAAVKQTVLPKFDYYLDESDPDILVLRRQDGSFVAHFSAQGATKEGIIQAAEEDYRAVLESEHAVSSGEWPPRRAPSA